MAKRIHSAVSARRRKLQATKQFAFAVAHDASGLPVGLTMFSGRRSLSRDLSVAEIQALVRLLAKTVDISEAQRACGAVRISDLFPVAVGVRRGPDAPSPLRTGVKPRARRPSPVRR